MLEAEDPDLVEAAAGALAAMGPAAAAAVPALARRLGQKKSGVTESLLEALRSMGPAALPAAPAITPILEDPSPVLRVAAREALAGIERGGR